MPLNIESEMVDQLAETLAARRHVSKTEAIRQALEAELKRMEASALMRERIREIQDRVASWEPTGLEADKAFYDSLNDE